MEFIAMTKLLNESKKRKVAIPQFNVNGYLWIQSIIEAAQEEAAPIIIGITDRNVEYLGGYRYIQNMISNYCDNYKIDIPIVLHLDHGASPKNCIKAINAGFSSVMFDGSHLPFEDNVAQTIEVVNYAEYYGVSVEGEIGAVGGTEDGKVANIRFADMTECKNYVSRTGINALAAALGSVHGEYIGEPELQFNLMEDLSKLTDVPFVLHGASGISDSDIKKAIDLGHAKINYNTELNLAYAQSLRNKLTADQKVFDPKVLFAEANQGIKKSVKHKINLLKNESV